MAASARLSLTFSVNAATLAPRELVLQSARSQPASFFALSGGSWDTVDGTVLTINITEEHQGHPRPCDWARLEVPCCVEQCRRRHDRQPLGTHPALQAAVYTADASRPTLTAFALDMNQGTLHLTFSETMIAGDLAASQLSLAGTSTSSGAVFTLPGSSSVVNVDAPVLRVSLLVSNPNEIKRLCPLASTQTAAFLSFSETAARDTVGNRVVSIAVGSVQGAAAFTPDSTSPRLVSWDLDMNAGTISLLFDETVDFETAQVTAVTLVPQADSTATPASQRRHTLSGSSTAAGQDGTGFTVVLSSSDLNALKLIEGLADNRATAYLAHSAQLVQDVSGNSVVVRTAGQGLQAASFLADSTAPQVLSFDLSMDTGALTLHMSEVVRAASVDVTVLRLQSLGAVANPTAVDSLLLLNSSAAGMPDADVVVVTLSSADMNTLKSIVALGGGASSSFLSLPAGFVEDMNGNRVVPVSGTLARQVSIYTPDTTAPLLTSFVLDRNQGQLTLVFSETLDESTFVPSRFTLQSAATRVPGLSLPLLGTFSRNNLVSIVLTLDVPLLDAIKALPRCPHALVLRGDPRKHIHCKQVHHPGRWQRCQSALCAHWR